MNHLFYYGTENKVLPVIFDYTHFDCNGKSETTLKFMLEMKRSLPYTVFLDFTQINLC